MAAGNTYYRAINKDGNTLDFLLSDLRNAFLAKALRRSRYYGKPHIINTDKNPAYPRRSRS